MYRYQPRHNQTWWYAGPHPNIVFVLSSSWDDSLTRHSPMAQIAPSSRNSFGFSPPERARLLPSLLMAHDDGVPRPWDFCKSLAGCMPDFASRNHSFSNGVEGSNGWRSSWSSSVALIRLIWTPSQGSERGWRRYSLVFRLFKRPNSVFHRSLMMTECPVPGTFASLRLATCQIFRREIAHVL